jgi:Helix-turn-helix domain
MNPEALRPALPEVPIEQWLSPKQIGAHFGLSSDSVYRWRSNGTIPPAFVKKFGGWRYKFHPGVVSLLEKDFEAAHLKRATERAQRDRAVAAE